MHYAAGNQGGSTPLSQLEILMQKMNQMEIQACARDAETFELRKKLLAMELKEENKAYTQGYM